MHKSAERLLLWVLLAAFKKGDVLEVAWAKLGFEKPPSIARRLGENPARA